MPEKVPLWVIQNTFKPYGNRMVKRADTLPDDVKVCATCQCEMYHIMDWHYCGEKYYCNMHIDEARIRQNAIWEEERKARHADWERAQDGRFPTRLSGFAPARVISHAEGVPQTEAEVPAGNLDEYLYQYWIGCNDDRMPHGVMGTRSTCRACGAVVFGALGRSIHKSESTRFYADSYSCMKVISLAIRNLAHLHNCFICKSYTNKKHYGVPICSPNCHKIWRFAEKMQYPELDQAIAPYWMSTVNIGTGGSTISESSSNQTPIVLSEADKE